MEVIMGGNGAYDEKWGGIPDVKRKYDEMSKKIDGHKIVVELHNPQHKSAPENSNSESPIYLCARVNKKTNEVQIHTIAFYSNHKLVKTIDLDFDTEGNLKPFEQNMGKKGRQIIKGTHRHKWDISDNGVVGRKSHKANNTFPIDTNSPLLKKIVEFNKQHNKWN